MIYPGKIRSVLQTRSGEALRRGLYDHVSEFVLRNGEEYNMVPDMVVKTGTKDVNFLNRLEQARTQTRIDFVARHYHRRVAALERPGLTYYEGFFISDKMAFPVAHNWVLNENEGVVEEMVFNSHCSQHKCQYFGVSFTRERFIETTNEIGYYGLMENEMGVNISLLSQLDRENEARAGKAIQ